MATAPRKADLRKQFEAAAAAAKQTKKKPDNATLLKLYSYYKQATEGDVQGTRPGGFDFVGGAKYDAWAKLKGMPVDEAMQNYVKQVERLNREERRRTAIPQCKSPPRTAGLPAGRSCYSAAAAFFAAFLTVRLRAGFGTAPLAPRRATAPRAPPDALMRSLTASESASTRCARRSMSFCV